MAQLTDQQVEIRDNAGRRVDALRTEYEHQQWREHHNDISRYMLTRRGMYLGNDDYEPNDGSKKNDVVNTGVAEEALHSSSAGMMDGFTSPSQPWVQVEPLDPDMKTFKPVTEYLWRQQRRMNAIFRRSNLYEVLPMVYQELNAFGIAALRVDESLSRTIHMTQFTIGSFYFSNGADGSVDTVARRFPLTVRQMRRIYDEDSLSIDVKNRIKNNDLDSYVKLASIVESNDDNRNTDYKDWRGMPWRSVTYEEHSTSKEMLKIGGFKRFPILTPRTRVVAGDSYGSSNGMRALPDTKEMQILEEKKKLAIAKQLEPPLNQPASTYTQGRASTRRNANNYTAAGQPDSVKPTFIPSIPYAEVLNEQGTLTNRINQITGADVFSLFSDLDLTGRRAMTATETAERRAEKTARFGPMQQAVFGMLTGLVELTWFYMAENDQLEEPPPEVGDVPIEVVFTSQQAIAQRGIETRGLEGYMGSLSNMANGGFPQVLDIPDPDFVARELQHGYLTNPAVVRDESVVDGIREAQVAQAQEQQQMQEGAAAAQVVKDLGGAPLGDENALETLTGAEA